MRAIFLSTFLKVTVDEFYMRYLKGSIHYKTLTFVIQLVLVLSHDHAAVERGFSLNDKLLFENMKSQSLIGQRCVKDFIVASNYSSHNVHITKNFMSNVKSSSQGYKAYLEEQRKSQEKTEQSKNTFVTEYKHEIISGRYHSISKLNR